MRSLSISVVFAVAALVACGGKSKQETAPLPEPEPAPAPVAEVEPAPEATPEPAAVTEGTNGGGELNEGQCNEVLDHVIGLLSEVEDPQAKEAVEMMQTNRATFVQKCQEEGTQKDYDCFMAATNAMEAMNCGS